MKTGYYLCGVSSQGNEEEKRLFDFLYDNFSHNQLTVGEAIDEVLRYNGMDSSKVINELYNECAEVIFGRIFCEGKFILSIGCTYDDIDVYLSDDLK